MSVHNFQNPGSSSSSGNGGIIIGGGGIVGGGAGTGSPSSSSPGSIDVPDGLINYNERYAKRTPLAYRDPHVQYMTSILIGQTKPNPLLTGAAGVGKTALVEELARRIETKDSRIPAQIAKHTIYELPFSSIFSGNIYVGQVEERLETLIAFFENPENKAICFIDEIHQLFTDNDALSQKAAQMMKPALARGDMKLIGATTEQEAKTLLNDPAMSRRFSTVQIEELTLDQTREVLSTLTVSAMTHYQNQITISDKALDDIMRIVETENPTRSHRPDNAITLLDRVMADTLVEHQAAIAAANDEGDTALATMLQSLYPLALTTRKIEKCARHIQYGYGNVPTFSLDKLRTSLSAVRGQEKAHAIVAELCENAAESLFPREKPLSFLFAGPSGVGKTETAKIMAHALTNDEPIILNMTEFSHDSDLTKILGAPPGYVGYRSHQERPFDVLKTQPHRLIVLDEMEKAHVTVQQAFLRIMDEGIIDLADGSSLSFAESVIVITTNAGREHMAQKVTGFGVPQPMTEQRLMKALEEAFLPEFLGRCEKIIAFEMIDEITYGEIMQDCYRADRDTLVRNKPAVATLLPDAIPDDLVRDLTRTYRVPELGARSAARCARTFIHDTLRAAQHPTGSPSSQNSSATSVAGAVPSDAHNVSDISTL